MSSVALLRGGMLSRCVFLYHILFYIVGKDLEREGNYTLPGGATS